MLVKDAILSIDVGTTILKIGIFNDKLKCLASSKFSYDISTPDSYKVEIDPLEWWNGFNSAVRNIDFPLENISIISLSTNSPGLSILNENGDPMLPSILHLDRRSKKQANSIIKIIGEDTLLEYTGNLPMLGGSSACSILWIKENYPEIYAKTFKFGHTNTFIANKLTGNFGIDPSNTSLTNMYNTTTYGNWNLDLIQALGIDGRKLPEILYSDQMIGKLKKEIALDLGFKAGIPVLMGGNDAICAVLGADVIKEGQMLDVVGTTELFNICTDKPIYSPKYNLRAHMIRNKWCTVFILNTAGKAIEWVFNNFYKDMKDDYFYNDYLPSLAVKKYKNLPKFVPYLCGDRYSINDRSASFSKIKLNMGRDDLLLAVLDSLAEITRNYLDSVGKQITLDKTINTSGGGINALITFKKKFFPDFNFNVVEGSSLIGAAKLAKIFMEEK
jgi:xylulokinase